MKSVPFLCASFLAGAAVMLTIGAGVNSYSRAQDILTFSATLDFPTNFTPDVATLSISTPGTVVGDVVALGCPLDIEGSQIGSFYAFASNDVTYVRAVHPYTANWNPLAGVYTVKVFK